MSTGLFAESFASPRVFRFFSMYFCFGCCSRYLSVSKIQRAKKSERASESNIERERESERAQAQEQQEKRNEFLFFYIRRSFSFFVLSLSRC